MVASAAAGASGEPQKKLPSWPSMVRDFATDESHGGKLVPTCLAAGPPLS